MRGRARLFFCATLYRRRLYMYYVPSLQQTDFAGPCAIVTRQPRQARKGAAAAELSMCAVSPAFTCEVGDGLAMLPLRTTIPCAKIRRSKSARHPSGGGWEES